MNVPATNPGKFSMSMRSWPMNFEQEITETTEKAMFPSVSSVPSCSKNPETGFDRWRKFGWATLNHTKKRERRL
jgi:hypothetical protein